nr:hypothetical protein [Tanacetum cinerariifolium]
MASESASASIATGVGSTSKDYAQNVKYQSKTGQYQHKIESPQQKPDQRAIFSKNQAIKPQKSKIQSSGIILANCSKSNQGKS